MEIKKIVFIEPTAETLNIFTRFKLPRLGNILLATILRSRQFADLRRQFLSKRLASQAPAARLVFPCSCRPTPSLHAPGKRHPPGFAVLNQLGEGRFPQVPAIERFSAEITA